MNMLRPQRSKPKALVVLSLTSHSFSYMDNPTCQTSMNGLPNSLMSPLLATLRALSSQIWNGRLIYSTPHLSRSLCPHEEPMRDYDIWVDASMDWGIGILWNGQWDAWCTTKDWRAPSWNIGWLKGVVAEIAILIMRDKDIWDADVLIHSDNKGVIGTFCKGCSSNFMVNLSIHCSKEIYPSMGLYVNICWHSSESRWSHLPRHPPSFTPSPPLSNTTSSPHLTILHSCLTPPHSQMHSRMSMLMQKWRPSMFKPEMTYKGLSLCLWMDKSEYHENLKKTLASSPHIFAPMFLQVIM